MSAEPESAPPATAAAPPPKPTKKKRVNVRTPDVMTKVQAQVEQHYRSPLVEKIRGRGGVLTVGETTVRLAQQFGFCYGVERAIDLAYAARKVFPGRRLFLIGEIIHNPEVNRQLAAMGIQTLEWREADESYLQLGPDDVVIVPAFGTTTEIMDKIAERGCDVVDTTCGDVMSVWKRVRHYAATGTTSIIHGKAGHEETKATAARALGDKGDGHFLVLLTLDDVDAVCRYILGGGDREGFLARFRGSYSDGFDPDLHLQKVGVANQTTMLKSETQEVQRRVAAAIAERDGSAESGNFQFFDTICGATQERQDALFSLLDEKLDLLLVVGGYNSSNTSHLVEIGERHLPTFFIRNADCLRSLEEIVHFDLEHGREHATPGYSAALAGSGPVRVGITAGASCPNNLIEDAVLKVFELRSHEPDEVARA